MLNELILLLQKIAQENAPATNRSPIYWGNLEQQ